MMIVPKGYRAREAAAHQRNRHRIVTTDIRAQRAAMLPELALPAEEIVPLTVVTAEDAAKLEALKAAEQTPNTSPEGDDAPAADDTAGGDEGEANDASAETEGDETEDGATEGDEAENGDADGEAGEPDATETPESDADKAPVKKGGSKKSSKKRN